MELLLGGSNTWARLSHVYEIDPEIAPDAYLLTVTAVDNEGVSIITQGHAGAADWTETVVQPEPEDDTTPTAWESAYNDLCGAGDEFANWATMSSWQALGISGTALWETFSSGEAWDSFQGAATEFGDGAVDLGYALLNSVGHAEAEVLNALGGDYYRKEVERHERFVADG